MQFIRCELKYCEVCGTLKLRTISSTNNHCPVCERMLARFRFPHAAVARKSIALPALAKSKMLAGIPSAICGVTPAVRAQ
jgi:hypothetical protein